MFKHATFRSVAIFIVLLIATSTCLAQGKHGLVGKFLKPSDADILFGKPVQSIPISKSDLLEAIKNADNYILFSIKNNRINITNEKKIKLTSNSHNANEKENMFFYSKSIISSLVNFAGEKQIFIEQRPNNIYSFTVKPTSNSSNSVETSNYSVKSGSIMNLTSTNDNGITLEMSEWCPPFCD